MAEGATPKDRFTALDTLALVRELRGIGGAHVDKAFDLPQGGWSMVLRVPGRGRLELLLVPGRYAALIEERSVHEEGLGPIAKELRRLLGGATLLGAAEPRSERYLELTFRRPDSGSLVLALEFFGAGNLVVARDGRIVAVSRPRAWAHRVVRVGAEYQRPPERGDPWSMSVADLDRELRRTRTDLTSTLAARLAFGGPVAEEVLRRSGLPGGPGPFPADAAATLHRATRALLDDVGDPPRGYVYLRGEEVVDATPYPSRRWTGDPAVRVEELPSFSGAAVRFFGPTVGEVPSELSPPPDPERLNLERQRERQRSAVEGLEAAARTRVAHGQAILAHFPEAERQLGEARKQTPPPEAIEIDLGGEQVTLPVRLDARASAQTIFEEAKRLKSKAAGAREALADTDAKLAEPSQAVAPARPRIRETSGRTRSGHWYTRFRWFVSSSGILVVAGRDASTNDAVVRRHLGERDLYVHADIHGAASVIVKAPERPQETIPESTIEEAGRFAVAFSKAWRAGLASADAFWATPDQVSKTPTTGEFVARGAWVIHGTKHYLKDLPLELALGSLEVDGTEVWVVAPQSALRARGSVRLLLTPGEERERGEREVELARETGLTRSALQALLPAGGIAVRRA